MQEPTDGGAEPGRTQDPLDQLRQGPGSPPVTTQARPTPPPRRVARPGRPRPPGRRRRRRQRWCRPAPARGRAAPAVPVRPGRRCVRSAGCPRAPHQVGTDDDGRYRRMRKHVPLGLGLRAGVGVMAPGRWPARPRRRRWDRRRRRPRARRCARAAAARVAADTTCCVPSTLTVWASANRGRGATSAARCTTASWPGGRARRRPSVRGPSPRTSIRPGAAGRPLEAGDGVAPGQEPSGDGPAQETGAPA